MVKKSKNKAQNKPRKQPTLSDLKHGINAFFFFLAQLCHIVGIPGVVVLFILYFIEEYATEEQKHDMIDYWILLKNTSDCTSLVSGFIAFFVLVFIIKSGLIPRCSASETKEIRFDTSQLCCGVVHCTTLFSQ